MTEQGYWFLDEAEYEPFLEVFEIEKTEYLSAISEIALLFQPGLSFKYFQEALSKSGSVGPPGLLNSGGQRPEYHPVPIVLNVSPNTHVLAELLYLGMALRDTRAFMGQSRAFKDITLTSNYRGSLFEIEVGAAIVRRGVTPRHSKMSPDFILDQLPLGIEATTRRAPIASEVTYKLELSLSDLNFNRLYVDILAKGEYDSDALTDDIRKDVERLLKTGIRELESPDYRIRHDFTEFDGRTVAISYGGEYSFGEIASHLLAERLVEKETKILKALNGQSQIKCVVAIDTRSLLKLPIEPESDYEKEMEEEHKRYYDKLRSFRSEVIDTCQEFVDKSKIVKGVLLWEAERWRSVADEVHNRYATTLVTRRGTVRLHRRNFKNELCELVD